MTNLSRNRDRIFISGLAVLNIAFHLVFYGNLEYHRDELLYFSLGLHPDFGYATVPPLIGWIAALMQAIFGYSLFAVKLFPALLSGVLVVVSAKIAKELGGGSYAQILTALAIVFMPVGIRAFHLFQPVPIDLFLWTLLIYYSIRYVNSEESKYLIIIGVVTGIALLNKYLIALLIIAILLSLAVSSYRKVFKQRSLYVGMGIAAIIFLPNLFWQIANDFPVTTHMRVLNANQLVYVERIGFFMDQLLMSFSVCFLLIGGLISLSRSSKYRYLAFTALIVFIALVLLRGKSYYTIGIFPLLIAAGTVAFERFSKNRIFRTAVPLIVVLLTLPALPIGMPIFNEEGLVRYFKDLEKDYGLEIGRRFEDGTIHSLPQDYADQLGWEELTTITSKAYQSIPEKDKALIYAENYGQAGAIAIIGKKYGLPEPVSFHESFFYWTPERFEPDIEYLIYINDEVGTDVQAVFEEIHIVGSISNINAREYGTTVYLCKKPKGSFNKFWKQVLERVDDPF